MNYKETYKELRYTGGGATATIYVSTKGRVKDYKQRLLRVRYQPYAYVSAYSPDDQKGVCVNVARAMLMAFRPRPDMDGLQVSHIDDNPQHNVISNLNWTTRARNNRRAHARTMRSRNHKCTSHAGTKLVAVDMHGNVVEAKNGREMARQLGVSHVLIYRILNPNDYPQTAKGYRITRVPSI